MTSLARQLPAGPVVYGIYQHNLLTCLQIDLVLDNSTILESITHPVVKSLFILIKTTYIYEDKRILTKQRP